MSTTLVDLHDVQGNIVKPYGRYGFPLGRYILFAVTQRERARAFVSALTALITTSAPWRNGGSPTDGTAIPEVTTNIAFTYHGLRDLGVPRASLQTFPDEFAMGMRARRDILGDDGASAPERWDPVWRADEPPHILIWLSARDTACLERRYREILALAADSAGGVQLLIGHRGAAGREDLPYQEASAIYDHGEPSSKEHFGYTDGISNPFFKGSGEHESNVVGGGKVTLLPADTRAGWEPLETGEFLLGYKDEALECPEAPIPKLLSHNGTFMVYRKLHENVGSFDDYLAHVGREYPGGPEALAAKFAGRWRNGAPLAKFPTEQSANEFAARWAEAKAAITRAKSRGEREAAKRHFAELNMEFVAFDYNKDLEGARCPIGAHTRRTNPRSGLEFGQSLAFRTPGAISNRRRIIRRGLPYGDSTERSDSGEHGIVFMALGASIRRQFEFIQQQWMNYANDFKLGNDKDPLVGNHARTESGAGDGRMLIATEPSDPRPPFFCSKLPRFVETRGGGYFFIPSLTALRMIGEGNIDPT